MEYKDFVNEINRIVTTNAKGTSYSNPFGAYIIDRVRSESYRGYQCSQHNRLTFQYLQTMLNSIYAIAKDKKFNIHVGDDDGTMQAQAATYYKVVDTIKAAAGKGTINSVKKNTFPDLARMGFLKRYDKNGVYIDERVYVRDSTNNVRKSVYSVQLSDMGLAFCQSNLMVRMRMYTQQIDIITDRTASELAEYLSTNLLGVTSIDILEYMYIFSDERKHITFNNKVSLMHDYRKLSKSQKEKIKIVLQEYCDPKADRAEYQDISKTELRDYSNWKNECQQIFQLLGNSMYFKCVEKKLLVLNDSELGLFNVNAKRSQASKTGYFKNHGIDKCDGYELHHVIPFAYAENKADAAVIDVWENFVYLHEDKHSEFTVTHNVNNRLDYDAANNQLLFYDDDGGCITAQIGTEVLVSPAMLDTMKKYNEKLVKQFLD